MMTIDDEEDERERCRLKALKANSGAERKTNDSGKTGRNRERFKIRMRLKPLKQFV